MKARCRNIVVISDTHFGSSIGLCPPSAMLDDDITVAPSLMQQTMWKLWLDFWQWAHITIGREPFILVHNGDMIDGNHHQTTQLMTGNLTDQKKIAVAAMLPHTELAAAYYQIRGTEAHVGKSAQTEELVADELKAVALAPNMGRHSHWELFMEFGNDLIHFAHHIGSTTSTAYESSAVMREMANAFVEAGQFNQRVPTILVRSHRHRYIKVQVPHCTGVVTPAWQGKTAFTHRIDRIRSPQFGGLLIRHTGHGRAYILERIYEAARPAHVIV